MAPNARWRHRAFFAPTFVPRARGAPIIAARINVEVDVRERLTREVSRSSVA